MYIENVNVAAHRTCMYLDVVHFNIYSKDYRIRKDQQKQKTKNDKKKNKQPNELHTHTAQRTSKREGARERSKIRIKNNENPEENHYTCGYHEQKRETRVRKISTHSHLSHALAGGEIERGHSKTSITINGKKCERTRDRKTKIMMKKKKKRITTKMLCTRGMVDLSIFCFAFALLVIIVFFFSCSYSFCVFFLFFLVVLLCPSLVSCLPSLRLYRSSTHYSMKPNEQNIWLECTHSRKNPKGANKYIEILEVLQTMSAQQTQEQTR